jgi:CDP-glycerol glycerophosphotransferase (TagB/SpsB family)
MFNQARSRFEQKRPNIVMIYTPWEIRHHAIFQAARSLKIPIVTYQHGGFEGNCEYTTYDLTDMKQSDFRLVYGDGIATYLKERKARSDESLAKVIPVGSTRLDTLRLTIEKEKNRDYVRRQLNISDSKILIAYLPTSYQYNWYMAREAYWGVPYMQFLIDTFEILHEFPQLHFIYKPFPEYPLDPMPKIIATRFQNCQSVSDISVSLLLQASDAFIIDIPSTGLLEALLTSKPIVAYSDSRFIALRPEARALLIKRVILSETPDDFIRQLRLFLNQGNFEKLEHANREFLRAYGAFNDDGNSAQRAATALKEIIQEIPKK